MPWRNAGRHPFWTYLRILEGCGIGTQLGRALRAMLGVFTVFSRYQGDAGAFTGGDYHSG